MKLVYYLCVISLLSLSACASHSKFSPQSNGSCAPKILERIYFGADSPDGPVSDQAWNEFLNTTITPRFPEGLTVFEANGQWFGLNNQIVKEKSRIVEIVHPDKLGLKDAVAEIATAYKKLFQQEAVLVLREPIEACL